jgi:uncharacterized protein YndB with AHSA1/START domain
MDYGSIERELYIEATPDVVFEVVSEPALIKDWWSADTQLQPREGSTSTLVWTDEATGRTDREAITVVEAEAPRRFVFRWTQPEDEAAAVENSLLVTFQLTPTGSGTTLRMTETGFRDKGWDIAVLEEQYNAHVSGWDFYLPRLVDVASRLASAR